MMRRAFIGIASALSSSLLAGCVSNNSNTDAEQNTRIDTTVDIHFVTFGDIIVQSSDGDIIPSGEEICMTIDGDRVAQTILNEDLHPGDDILHIEDGLKQYNGSRNVGIYLDEPDNPIELYQEVTDIPRPYNHSQSAIDVDLETDFDQDTNTVTITHNGGVDITNENTDLLFIIGGELNESNWKSPLTKTDNVGEGAYVEGGSESISDGDVVGKFELTDETERIRLVWRGQGHYQPQTLKEFNRP